MPMLDARDTMVDVDGNFSQVEFALSSWRETFLKVEIACSILVRIYGGKKSCTGRVSVMSIEIYMCQIPSNHP
jgi:hypothetical protein